MRSFRSLAVTLVVTYSLGVIASRWLVLRAVAFDAPLLTSMLAVPLVQTALVFSWRRWFGVRKS